MNKLTNHRFDETIYTHQFDNGLTVIMVHKPEFKTSVALLGTNFGAKHLKQIVNGQEQEYNSGVAHFLEHKLFEKQDEDVLSTFTNMGANANAFTSYNETVYYFSTTNDLKQPLNTLLDFVLNLEISTIGVEKEKGIIIEELKMYQEMPLMRLNMELLESLYQVHPLKYDIGGTADTVSKITKEELEKAYRTNYHPSQLVLSIVSPVDPNQILEWLNDNIKNQPIKEKLDVMNPLTIEPVNVNRKLHELKMNVGKDKIALAYKQNIQFENELDVFKANVMAQMILDLNFSKLNPDYQNWIDEGIINDFFVYQADFGLDYGYIAFFWEKCRIPVKKRQIPVRFCGNSINYDKLKLIKKRYLGETISELSDFESFAISNFRTHFIGSNPFELIEVIESISADDLQTFLSQLNFEEECEVIISN